jgi:Leucine-rich repeat (LRR) protein
MIDNSTTSYITNNTVKVYARGDVYSLDLKKQQITALDVSKLTELDYLDCSDNSLATLDVSNNPELWALDCSSNNLGALDLSQNTIIEELDCSTNGISSLNLSSNTILKVLNFSGNKISSINLSANGALTSLNASSNQLNLPPYHNQNLHIPYMEYASQANFSATCSNGVVDLSSQLMAVDKDGNTQTTVYTWFLADGTLLTKGTDYVEGNGMFYFTQMPVSTVYCEMNNAAFSALTLRTPNITVDAVVNPNITFVSENNGTLSFKASNSQAGKVYVDWGDGNLTTYYLTTDVVTISTSAYVAGSTVKVYGRDMTEFDARNSGLVAIDVSNASTLTYLNCGSNKLQTLDVSTNTALHTISLF